MVNFSVPWCVAVSFVAVVRLQPCCQHPPESRAAPRPASFMLEIDGDSNTVRSLAKQHELQFISKVSAYLSLLHYCHLYAWDFHLKKKISLPSFLWRQKNESAESYFHLGISSFLSNYRGGVSEYFISDQEENPKIIFSLFRSLSGRRIALFFT